MIKKLRQTVYYMQCDYCGYESQQTKLTQSVCAEDMICKGWSVDADNKCRCKNCNDELNTNSNENNTSVRF